MPGKPQAEASPSSTHRATPDLPPSLFGDPFTCFDDLPPAQRRTVRRAMRRAGNWPELRGRNRPRLYIARITGAVFVVRFCRNGLTVKVLGDPTPAEHQLFSSMAASAGRFPAPAVSITRVQKPNQPRKGSKGSAP